MGGKFCSLLNPKSQIQDPFFCFQISGHSMDASLMFHSLVSWQWLGLDKEANKLVVETTANQVDFGKSLIINHF